MSNIIKFETPELDAIEKSKAQQIKATFEPMVLMLENFEDRCREVFSEASKEITPGVSSKAKRVRLDIAKVRIEADKARKAMKEEYLRAGNAIQGTYNVLAWAVKDREDKLREIEEHAERIERERIERLQSDRVKLISEYVDDAETRDLASMDNEAWEFYLAGKKQQYDDRIEAEKKAEAERIAREKAEAAERERIRKDNERLRAEAAERERLEKIESEKRAKAERERIAKEEAEKAEREKRERKEREAYEAKLKAEREERERIQKELEAKAEAERKAEEAVRAQIEAELKKGDAQKVADLINDLESIKTRYSFKSAKNKKMYSDVCSLVEKIINHINQ